MLSRLLAQRQSGRVGPYGQEPAGARVVTQSAGEYENTFYSPYYFLKCWQFSDDHNH